MISHIRSNTTTCGDRIIITIDLPEDCRLNSDLVRERFAEIFRKGILRDLCQGCPLEKISDPKTIR